MIEVEIEEAAREKRRIVAAAALLLLNKLSNSSPILRAIGK
jgi:hypothetical protein